MIYSISANDQRFKTLTLHAGLNVVIADTTERSSSHDTRNGVGKTLIMEILHFCLGGSTPRTGGLASPQLIGWAFTVDLDVGPDRVQVTRSLGMPKTVSVTGNFDNWPVQPTWDKETGSFRLTNEAWKKILGETLFDLSSDDRTIRFGPSFRLLFPYFARVKTGAYETPFKYFSSQREWQKQVAVAFLLGLSWDQASQFQDLKEQRDALRNLKRALEQGALGDTELTLGRLRTQSIQVRKQIHSLEAQLLDFEVHPEYRAISDEANALTSTIHTLVNRQIARARTITMYEQQADIEQEPDAANVVEIFERVGVELSMKARQTLLDAQEFHTEVVENRRLYLRDEINALRRDEANDDAEVARLSARRAKLMDILETKHALEEYTRLNERLSSFRAELADIESQIGRVTEIDERQAALEITGQTLTRDSRRELAEREPEWSEAISLFASNTEALYGTPGELVIDLSDNGFAFDVNIDRSGSHGINNMKIFAFDLMLAQRWSTKTRSPCLLWHDSELFDGVDERQVGAALQLAANEAITRGFQYFCSLNSDDLPPQNYLGDLDLKPILTLTDESEDGGIFGMRF